ncbi:MAG: hypothetical protein R3B71_05370 [Candidatus Gracilibacteria bacterium]|nr:hypothetical protein [Candidatus Peregrinibacteria bacterium]
MNSPHRSHGLTDQLDDLKAQVHKQQEIIDGLTRNQAKLKKESRFRNGMILCGGTMLGLALNAHDVQTSTANQVAQVCPDSSFGGAVDSEGGVCEAEPEMVEVHKEVPVSRFDSFQESSLHFDFDLPVYKKEEPEPIVWLQGSFDTAPVFPDDSWIRNYPFLVREEEHPKLELDIIPIELIQ